MENKVTVIHTVWEEKPKAVATVDAGNLSDSYLRININNRI